MLHLLRRVTWILVMLTPVVLGTAATQAAGGPSFLNTLGATPTISASTVPTSGPSAGDQNPYGVALVPTGFPTTGVLPPVRGRSA